MSALAMVGIGLAAAWAACAVVVALSLGYAAKRGDEELARWRAACPTQGADE